MFPFITEITHQEKGFMLENLKWLNNENMFLLYVYAINIKKNEP